MDGGQIGSKEAFEDIWGSFYTERSGCFQKGRLGAEHSGKKDWHEQYLGRSEEQTGKSGVRI